jgi:DHA1 family bicyclomycin/chloramphenicol resistance-like MFS transporter
LIDRAPSPSPTGTRRLGWALLLAGLGSIGPFTVDTYLPAFTGMAQSLHATPVQMQQTLSLYMLSFAFMSLFHGALSDSFGRKPVILIGLLIYSLASAGCALASTIDSLIIFRIIQGFCAGAGMVVSRAIIRDLFAPDEAQRMMSTVTVLFGAAPAIAPFIGGWIFVLAGWHAIFWFLAALGGALAVGNLLLLPESLPREARQPFGLNPLYRAYKMMLTNRRFILLSLANTVPFNGMFIYVCAAPEFLGNHLRLQPTEFFWLFLFTVSGIMSGAALSGRLAGRVSTEAQVWAGIAVMALGTVLNMLATGLPREHWLWALAPIAIYTLGWSLMTPAVTIRALDLYPQRRGMASSLLSCLGGLMISVVAGVIVPLTMHSPLQLALASATMMLIGALSWAACKTATLDPAK